MKTKVFALVAALVGALSVAGGAFASTISQSSDQSNMTGQFAFAKSYSHHGSAPTATNTNTTDQGNLQVVVAGGHHTPNVSQSSDQSNGTLQGAVAIGSGASASNSNTTSQGSAQIALLGRYGNH